MEEREYVELRSEEVQEILGTPPGWLVSWGTMIVLLCFTALLGVAAMISYPDVIEAKVVITTAIPPVDVIARTDGHIARLFVRDKVAVKQGTILAVLQSTANFEDIQKLDSAVVKWQSIGGNALKEIRPLQQLEIGELQANYSAFVQDVEKYRFGTEDRKSSLKRNIGSMDRQIEKIEKSIAVDQKSMRRLNEQLKTARELYQKQLELYNLGLISRVDLEHEKQKADDLERQYDALEDNIFRKQNEIISLGKNKNEATFSEKEDVVSNESQLRQSLNSLRASLDQWKQTYLLTAPIDGRVINFSLKYDW